jgi:hypothetical protein
MPYFRGRKRQDEGVEERSRRAAGSWKGSIFPGSREVVWKTLGQLLLRFVVSLFDKSLTRMPEIPRTLNRGVANPPRVRSQIQ